MDINIIPFFSPITPEGVKDRVQQELVETGVNIIEPEKFAKNPGRSYILIGTGGTENLVADFLDENELPSPISILSYDLRNSQPSAMEIRSYLEQHDIESKIIHAPIETLVEMVRDWAEFAKYLSKIDGSTIGVIGEPSSWLIASTVNPDAVKKKWGLFLKNLSLDPLIEAASSSKKYDHIESFKQNAKDCTPSDEELHKAGSVAEGLRGLMKQEQLDTVTVQCFKLLMDTKVSGCYALNFLNNDKELVVGCEGDVPATFTMLLGKLLTDSPGFMSNVTQVDKDNNTVVFAHCTLPTSIAESYQVTTHFETGLSIGIRGMFAKQDVTVFKVFGDDLTDFWVSDGIILENLINSTGCRTQIRVELKEDVNYFLERAYANHHIVFPGRHAERIRRFFEFF
jgi:L-fucose isomerase-like protein